MVNDIKYHTFGKTLRCLKHDKLSVNTSYQLLDCKVFESILSFVHVNQQISEKAHLDGFIMLY